MLFLRMNTGEKIIIIIIPKAHFCQRDLGLDTKTVFGDVTRGVFLSCTFGAVDSNTSLTDVKTGIRRFQACFRAGLRQA